MKKYVLSLLAILLFTSSSLLAAPTGKIIYVDVDSMGRCYLTSISPDGTNKTRLTPAYNNMMFPRHNKKLGWIGFTNKTNSMKSEIYLLNKKGNRVRRVLTDAALEDFSPDGKFMLYTTCNGKGELYVYSLERKRAVKISQNLKVTSANWSPDKKWIAVSALEADGSTNIYLISTMAMGIRKISNTAKINESFPVFSPDSKYLVYFTNKLGRNTIEYYDIANKKIQTPVLSGMFPWLSPDAKWVVFERGKSIGLARSDGLNYKTLCSGKTPIWVK